MLKVPYLIKNKINFLLEASKILSSSLDYNVTLAIIAKLLVSNVADFCMIDIFDGKKLKRLAVKASDRSKQGLVQEMFNFMPDPQNKNAIYEVAKTGNPILVKKATKSWLKMISKIKEERETIEKLGLNSHLFVPLKSRGIVIGVLTIASTDKKFSYTEEDASFVMEVANRAGIVVDKSRLYFEAQEAIRTRDEFISIASHELKTPLTAILLNLELALHRIQKTKTYTPEINKIIETIEISKQQTRRMTKLISDLLNVSVVSTGRLTIEKEKVELASLMEEVISRFAQQLKNSNIKVEFRKNKKVFGMWDGIRMEQVFSNLISNAIKYGREKPIRIEVFKSKDKAVVKFQDQGIGISKSDQMEIFKIFKRAATDPKYRGLGVGLYISKQIILAHKGKLKVESDVGKGSTFTIELPL